MRVLYGISIQLYRLGILLASPFKIKAKQWVSGRKNWRSKFKQHKNGPYIWFHAASLGEFESAKPIIELLKKAHPQKRIWVTFFSPSGYEQRKNDPTADVITYLPLDSKKNARDFLDIVRPEVAIFIRYEFWLFYLDELASREIPLIIASATFREGQFLLSSWGTFLRRRAKALFAILVQDENSLALLQQHGFKNAAIAGDTRVDRVVAIAKDVVSFPFLDQFLSDKKVFIAGSSWPADEAIFLATALASDDIKVILAPHEVHHSNILRLSRKLGSKGIRWSELTAATAQSAQVLLIDNIGLLAKLYRYADFAFVGGGFTTGIHNVLEATVYGCPVIFGPNHQAFPEGKGLLASGGGFCVSQKFDFEQIWKQLTQQEAFRAQAAQAAQSYTLQRAGATEKTVGVIQRAMINGIGIP